MSTGTTQRLHADALAEAEAFRDLFPGCWSRWEIAGSVRRGKSQVGDVEHVVIPCGRRLWDRVDELTADPHSIFGMGDAKLLDRAVYSDGRHRWGQRYRGVMFRGFRHEIFTADNLNWGAILTIRTGPALFSKDMVTRLKRSGQYHHEEGYVKQTSTGAVLTIAAEPEFFALCGMPWLEPKDRG